MPARVGSARVGASDTGSSRATGRDRPWVRQGINPFALPLRQRRWRRLSPFAKSAQVPRVLRRKRTG